MTRSYEKQTRLSGHPVHLPPHLLIVSLTHAINIWLFSSCFLIMSIIAVPDHFYYSSLRSLQSVNMLSGNEIPVLKTQVQIEGHQLHWQGAISSAIQRCHCLLTCSSKVSSSVFVAIPCLVLSSLFFFFFVCVVWVSPIPSRMCLADCYQGVWVHRYCTHKFMLYPKLTPAIFFFPTWYFYFTLFFPPQLF